MESPVVLFLFNRPDHTERVLRQIRAAQPKTLIVFADGPRTGNASDPQSCEAARAKVNLLVDWEPDLHLHYSPHNLGCRERVRSGIELTFERFDRAIFLEDDCVPSLSFFRFCDELLAHYEHTPQVGTISGNQFVSRPSAPSESYRFSKYNHTWGWATWRRAWSHYDFAMSRWPELKAQKWLHTLFADPLEAGYWENIFDSTHRGDHSIWDYQWQYSSWLHHLLCIVPHQNLVTNVGHGNDATHTSAFIDGLHEISATEISFPLRHPKTIEADHELDSLFQKTRLGKARNPSPGGRIRRIARKLVRSFQKRALGQNPGPWIE